MFFLGWALAAALPVELVDVDARGCGRPALRDGRRLEAAAGLCVKRVLSAHLEDPRELDVILIVTKDGRDRLFVYRLEGGALVPRFLGSGPRDLTLRDVRVHQDEALEVELADREGATRTVRCRFEAFPLVCR